MSRITAAIAALALAAAPLAHASSRDAVDRVCTRDTETFPRTAGLRHELTAIFAAQAVEEDPNSLTAPGSFELLVVRLDADGKPVMACVDSEEAARRFLDAPREKVQSKKAQEK